MIGYDDRVKSSRGIFMKPFMIVLYCSRKLSNVQVDSTQNGQMAAIIDFITEAPDGECH